MQERLTHLDGWRGLAILVLFCGHFFPVPYVNLGAVGVELFFVLSGRLMADLLFVKRYDLGFFLRRRISRIVPNLLTFTTLVFALAAVLPGWLGTVGLDQYLAGSLFFANYFHAFSGMPVAMANLWSLAVEEHGYILLALLALATARSTRQAAVIAIVSGLLIMGWGAFQNAEFGVTGDAFWWRTDVRVASMLFPMGLYLLVREFRGSNSLIVGAITPCGLLVGLVLMSRYSLDWLRYSGGTIAFAFAVVFVDRSHAFVRRILEARPLVWAGVVSYSVYLWQQPFYANKAALGAPIAAFMGVAAALIVFALVERPVRRALNQTWARAKEPLPTAGALAR